MKQLHNILEENREKRNCLNTRLLWVGARVLLCGFMSGFSTLFCGCLLGQVKRAYANMSMILWSLTVIRIIKNVVFLAVNIIPLNDSGFL